jgi:nicotinamide-nucleotide amidase
LGVSATTIENHGVVSEAVAKAMASGAQQQAEVEHAIAVTGVAGPTGGSVQIPVGTVWFGYAGINDQLLAVKQHFVGDRAAVREQSVVFAINWLIQVISEN